jgi:hypothetical protein
MEIKYQKIVDVSVNIELPLYSKSSAFIYKVVSEEVTITVGHSGSHKSIEVSSLRSTNALEETANPATEEEFWELYNQTKDFIYAQAISG